MNIASNNGGVGGKLSPEQRREDNMIAVIWVFKELRWLGNCAELTVENR